MKEYMELSGGTRIPLDVVTRWNSKFLMISIINKNIDVVNDLGKKGSLPDNQIIINNEDAKFLKDIEIFLKPFFNITQEISSDTNSTIGSAVLFIDEIVKTLEDVSENHENETLKNAASVMLKKSKIYMKHINTLSNYISCLLDPKTKKKFLPKFINNPDYFKNFETLYIKYKSTMSGSSAYDYNEPDMEAMPYSVRMHNKLRRLIKKFHNMPQMK
ncbi:uncharacterized protein LOC135922079 [Gordionus sp. m RMFG-2023]|uniref:uncharacterized protein LOC135922079 n=1 Tax=Gordionus sp. m RMFG-2023 TaxID=3053472 RepID=UPI0031FDEAB2